MGKISKNDIGACDSAIRVQTEKGRAVGVQTPVCREPQSRKRYQVLVDQIHAQQDIVHALESLCDKIDPVDDTAQNTAECKPEMVTIRELLVEGADVLIGIRNHANELILRLEKLLLD